MEDKAKKQVPLRLSPALYSALAAWAEDDFRSLNGQIEYLLTQCVKRRRRTATDDTLTPPTSRGGVKEASRPNGREAAASRFDSETGKE